MRLQNGGDLPGRTDNLWMNPVQGEIGFLTREGGIK